MPPPRDPTPPSPFGHEFDGVKWTMGDKVLDLGRGISVTYWISEKREGSALCLLCEEVFTRPSNLKRHYQSQHFRSDLAQRETPEDVKARKATRTGAASSSSSHTLQATGATPLSGASSSSSTLQSSAAFPLARPLPPVDWDVNIPPSLIATGLAVLGNHFNAILCLECEICIPAEFALGHLDEKHKYTKLSQEEFAAVVRTNNLDRRHKDIINNVKASRSFQQCPWLEQTPGWWCEECGYATTSQTRAEEHQKRPGHAFTEEEVYLNGDRHRRLRRVLQGTVQSLFAVNLSGIIPSIPYEAQGSPATAFQVFTQLLALDRELFNPPLVSQDDPRTVHPFIRISGFQRWLKAMGLKEVEALQALMKLSTMPLGKRLERHCKEMMDCSFALCMPELYMARCHVNSPTTTISPTPFGELATDTAQNRYCSTWASLIAFLINCQGMEEEKCRFHLSPKQRDQLLIYIQYLQDASSELDPKDPESVMDDAVEALTLLSASLFCHEFQGTGSSSSHPIIAYTILSNVRLGNVIANPVHISPFLAPLEYFCRTTIMVSSNMATTEDPPMNFFDAVKIHCKWIKEGENTPFAWIRQMLHLTASFVHGANQMPRFVWGLDDGKSYTFDGFRIYVVEFIALVRTSVQDAIDGFFDLCDTYGLPNHLLFTSLDEVGDALASRTTNYNFARHSTNVSLQDRAKDCQEHMVNSGKFCKVVMGRLVWHPNVIREALKKSEAFLRCLAVALYLGSGQPPRGSELMSTLLVNIDTRVRNLFYSNNSAVLSHFLNKTSFNLKSDKAIVREVCHALSLVLLNYVAFFRSWEATLGKQVGWEANDIEWTLRRLFQLGPRQLNTDILTSQLQQGWRKHVTRYGDRFPGWGTADTRQNAIYVGKHCVRTPAFVGNEGEALLDLQAGHTSNVARNWYGVEGNRLGGDIDPAIMAQFCALSRGHHSSYGLTNIPFQHSRIPLPESLPPSSTAPMPFSPNQFSATQVPPSSLSLTATQCTLVATPTPSAPLIALDHQLLSTQLTNSVVRAIEKMGLTSGAPIATNSVLGEGGDGSHLPASRSTAIDPVVFTALREIVPAGRFRSVEQAAAVQAAWKREHHLLAILPTGGGKTLVVEVTSWLERRIGMLNVMMVPLKALAEDLKSRFARGGMMVEVWRGRDTPECQVLIAIFENASNADFLDRLRDHSDKKTLGRIVIDECHYPVFSTRSKFREGMRSLSGLVGVGSQIVLLTATAPALSTGQILDFYGVPSATVVRASTNRPNILYTVTKLGRRLAGMPEAQFHLEQIKISIQKHKPDRDCRVIVYMRSKQSIDAVWQHAQESGDPWVRYHANLTLQEKEAALAGWTTVLIATSAFGLGVDPQDCGLVVHYEAPHTMLDYVQESGRAGRDGQDSAAVLLWSWKPNADAQDHGQMAVTTMLESTLCRRRIIFGYMDGSAADCLSSSATNRMCDNCINAIERVLVSEQRTAPAPNPVGPAITQNAVLTSFTEFSDQLRVVDTIANVLNTACSICYLQGKDHQCHRKRGEWWCNPQGNFMREELDKYKEWKLTWVNPTGDSFERYICNRCWLPGTDVYHDLVDDPTTQQHKSKCYQIDGLGPLAWAVFHNLEVLEEYTRAHPHATVGSLEEWSAWVCKPGTAKTPRFWEMAIWVDQWMHSKPGRYTLVSYHAGQ